MQTRATLAQVLPFPAHPMLTWPDGRPVRAIGRSSRGRLIWPVHGGSPEGDPPPEPDPDKNKGEKKHTDADMAAIAAREKDLGERRGAAAAHKKLMADLGLPEDTKPEDVKATLAKARKAELDAMTDADRAKAEAQAEKDEAARAKAALDKEREDLAKERHDTRVTGLLERAGVGVGKEFDDDPAKRERAIARAAKALATDVEVGADSDDIRKGIEQLKKDAPGMFGTKDKKIVDGRPEGTAPVQRKEGQSAKEAGREAAKRYFGVKDKQAS